MLTSDILALLIAERDKLDRAIEALQGPAQRGPCFKEHSGEHANGNIERTAWNVCGCTESSIPQDEASRDGHRLTSRQRDIVKLIAEDLSAKAIGERLGISAKTVAYHRDIIKKRLSITGTAGIVRYVIRHGIIEP